MKKFTMALLMPALLIGCSQDTQHGSFEAGQTYRLFDTQDTNAITVKTIDGMPIAGAEILIGDALDNPFPGNFLKTNQNGQVSLPESWTTPQTVTVQAPGFVRSTYMMQNPEALTIQLRPLISRTQNEVRGNTQGLPVADKDGWLDFGLVIPALTRIDLLAFDMSTVISPQKDRVSALGQDMDVPANISLPRQSEKYGIFTITLDKPAFRIYYGTTGVNRVFAARGRLPFKSTVDSLRGGKEFYEMINTFKINGGAIRDIDVKSGQTKLDMPTTELNFTESKSLQAPTFRADETFLAVGLADQSGFYIPTDVKQLAAGQKMALNTLPGAEQMVFAVLKKSADMKSGADRVSTALLPFAVGVTPQLLPLIPDPQIVRDELIMPKFNTINGVHPIATYSVLNKEEEVVQGGVKVKILTPQWEVYAQNWQERVRLPQWPNSPALPGKKRWDVNFMGSQTTAQAPMGPAMIQAATHVTHSSVTF